MKWIGLAVCLAAPLQAQTALSDNARRQIAELLADKASRSPVERKLGSHLIYGARMARGQRITPSIDTLPLDRNTLQMKGDLVHVDVNGEITDKLIQAVNDAGGQIVSALPKFRTLNVWIPLLACEKLAARNDVETIMPAPIPTLASHPVSHPGAKPAATLRARMGALFGPPQQVSIPDQGGLIAEGIDQVQAMGYTGSGVKIGVMSDGVDSLSQLQMQGYLPQNITVLQGQAGSGDEGTALLNVVYDMAPGAQLYYASAHISEAQMAANIMSLVDNYGINILVDDVNWSDEGFFQDTTISQAINYAVSKGVLCFTAAGNNNNFDSATSGTWLGDFTASGSTISISGVNYQLHDFGNGLVENPVSPQPDTQAPGLWFVLQWSDPWDCPTNNYDLFLVIGGSVVGASTNLALCVSGSYPEQYISQGQLGVSVVIAKDPSSATRAIELSTGRAVLGRYSDGAVQGHSGAANEVVVAAADVFYTNNQLGGGGLFTGGAVDPIDLISSDGPRLMFFDPNGNPLNPGAPNPFTIAGGGAISLAKVDITASDGVNTAVPAYNPFGGTSAAAPHAAAIGALLKSANAYISNTDIVNAMKCTALPVTANSFFDGNLQLGQPNGVFPRTQGAGIAMANLAIGAIFPQVTIASKPSGQSFTISGSGCQPGTYSTPTSLKLPTDASCTVTLSNPTIPGGTGARQIFNAWSDGDTSNPKSFTVPVCSSVTYTASYQQEYQLTAAAYPSSGGAVAAVPSSADGYYPAGATVQLTATPANGYSLTQWNDDAGGTANPVSVTLSAPRFVTADFANPAVSAVSLNMVSQGGLAGQALQIPIQLAATGAAVPANFQFDLSFDPTKLAFTSAQAAASLTGAGKSLSTQTLPNGNIRLTSTGANPTTLPAGTVASATMTLNPQFSVNGTLLTMLNCSATDAHGSSLTTNCGSAVVESGWCDVQGTGVVGTTDVEAIISEALGLAPPANDLTHAGAVTVGTVQVVINASNGLGCAY
jgi:hypothetical protein